MPFPFYKKPFRTHSEKICHLSIHKSTHLQQTGDKVGLVALGGAQHCVEAGLHAPDDRAALGLVLQVRDLGQDGANEVAEEEHGDGVVPLGERLHGRDQLAELYLNVGKVADAVLPVFVHLVAALLFQLFLTLLLLLCALQLYLVGYGAFRAQEL